MSFTHDSTFDIERALEIYPSLPVLMTFGVNGGARSQTPNDSVRIEHTGSVPNRKRPSEHLFSPAGEAGSQQDTRKLVKCVGNIRMIRSEAALPNSERPLE